MKKTQILLTILIGLVLLLPFTIHAQSQNPKSHFQNPIRAHAEKQIRNTYGSGKATKITLTKASLTKSDDLLGASVDVSGIYHGKLLQISLIDTNLPLYDKAKQEITVYRYNSDKYYSSDQGTLNY